MFDWLGKLRGKSASGLEGADTVDESMAQRRALREWFAWGLGAELAAAEQAHLQQVLPTLFGYHLLQVGYPYGVDHLSSSYVQQKWIVELDHETPAVTPHCYAHSDQLPVKTDSVDLVVLPHVLETHRDPHRVLREIDRILVPEGHVVIVGVNPWSLWGVRRWLPWRRSVLWENQFISPTRVKDWLALLGFEQTSVATFFFKPPIKQRALLRKLGVLEKLGQKLWPAFGGVYIFVARKRVSTLTPVKPRWARRTPVVRPGLIETRNKVSDN